MQADTKIEEEREHKNEKQGENINTGRKKA